MVGLGEGKEQLIVDFGEEKENMVATGILGFSQCSMVS
jgi:hypothetical protein